MIKTMFRSASYQVILTLDGETANGNVTWYNYKTNGTYIRFLSSFSFTYSNNEFSFLKGWAASLRENRTVYYIQC